MIGWLPCDTLVTCMFVMHAVSSMLEKSPPKRGNGTEEVILATSNMASTVKTRNTGLLDWANKVAMEAQGA
jgi:hypothetical protein